MKLIIAGGRDFSDKALMRESMELLWGSVYDPITEVVCGMARGADLFGRCWAIENGIDVKEFPADWDRWGRRAGFVRNGEMADYAQSAVVFWDGQSKGSRHMINLMEAMGKNVTIINYGGSE
jgi:hypothetical protein